MQANACQKCVFNAFPWFWVKLQNPYEISRFWSKFQESGFYLTPNPFLLDAYQKGIVNQREIHSFGHGARSTWQQLVGYLTGRRTQKPKENQWFSKVLQRAAPGVCTWRRSPVYLTGSLHRINYFKAKSKTCFRRRLGCTHSDAMDRLHDTHSVV